MVNNVGDKIREYREKAGISQKKLGLALGLSDKAVSAYESGRTLPPLETLYRIAEELDKPLKFFLSTSDETTIHERLESIVKSLESISSEIELLKKDIAKK